MLKVILMLLLARHVFFSSNNIHCCFPSAPLFARNLPIHITAALFFRLFIGTHIDNGGGLSKHFFSIKKGFWATHKRNNLLITNIRLLLGILNPCL